MIDKGVLKNVPYISFRCGDDYECNVYGDPDHPACVEIGVYRNLLNDPVAKTNCVSFMAELLTNSSDKNAVTLLDENYKMIKHPEVTFELTLPKDDDSYGGWWISVYSQSLLDAARASDSEMKNISVPNIPGISPDDAILPSPDLAKQTPYSADATLGYNPTNWTFADVQGHVYSNTVFSSCNPAWVIVLVQGYAMRFFFTNLPPESRTIFHYDRAKAEAFLEHQKAEVQAQQTRSAEQLARARAARPTQPTPEVSSPLDMQTPAMPAGGSVYVRGYQRANGTYVSGYTRSR